MPDDFSNFDAYIDDIPLIFYESEDAKTRIGAMQLQPTRSDTGENADEIRPEYGNFYAQGDFSAGAGQRWFHKPGADKKRFLYSDGLDIFHLHSLRHGQANHLMPCNDVIKDNPAAIPASYRFCLGLANSRLYIGWGTGMYYKTSPTAAWVAEASPFAAEAVGANYVYDMATVGDVMYAALGSNGLHKKASGAAGAWSHYSDVEAYRVAFIKDRVMVMGGTNRRMLYEVTAAGAAPTPLDTLQTGWQWESWGELNGYIYAIAQNSGESKSRIYYYGLNSTGTALEKKAYTPMPDDEMAASLLGYLGALYIGSGKVNAEGGKNAVFYQGIQAADGSVNLVKLDENYGAEGQDLSVKALMSHGESVLYGWSQGGDFGFGKREGLAAYHAPRDGSANFLRDASRDAGAAISAVVDIVQFQGRTCYVVDTVGFHYEDTTKYESATNFVASIGEHNNAGAKQWDAVEAAASHIDSGAAVDVYYTDMPPEHDMWTLAFTMDDPAQSGERIELPTEVDSRYLAVRIVIRTNVAQTAHAEVTGFAVRSNPLPTPAADWVSTIWARLLPEDRKDEWAEPQYADTTARLKLLMAKQYTKVEVRLAGLTFKARLEGLEWFKPAEMKTEGTGGDPEKQGYLLQMTLIGSLQ